MAVRVLHCCEKCGKQHYVTLRAKKPLWVLCKSCAHKGKLFSEGAKAKLRQLVRVSGSAHPLYGIPRSPEVRDRISKATQIAMAQLPEEIKAKLRQGARITISLTQKDKATKQKMSQSARERWADSSFLKKMQDIHRHLWQNPEFRTKAMKATLKGLWKRPTRPEQFLIDFFKEHNLPFRYVGDGEVVFGGKCPDFINTNGQKQLIELFGTFWHPLFDVAKRTEHFREYGFSLLIIWEDELEDEARLLKKVKTFTRRKRW